MNSRNYCGQVFRDSVFLICGFLGNFEKCLINFELIQGFKVRFFRLDVYLKFDLGVLYQ